MVRIFILTEEFERQLKNLLNSEEILRDIEQEIFMDLENSISSRDIIQGTGGFTKLRVPLKMQNIGKSGALRVIENISDKSKKILKQISEELKAWQPKKKL